MMPKHRDNIRGKTVICARSSSSRSNEAGRTRQHQVKRELKYPSAPFDEGCDNACEFVNGEGAVVSIVEIEVDDRCEALLSSADRGEEIVFQITNNCQFKSFRHVPFFHVVKGCSIPYGARTVGRGNILKVLADRRFRRDDGA